MYDALPLRWSFYNEKILKILKCVLYPCPGTEVPQLNQSNSQFYKDIFSSTHAYALRSSFPLPPIAPLLSPRVGGKEI